MAPATIKDLATAASEAAAAMTSLLVPDTTPETNAAASPSPAPEAAMSEAGQQESRDGPVARGALIVLEGLDRSGKTTQVKLLEQRFVELGKKVKVMRFPGMLIIAQVFFVM